MKISHGWPHGARPRVCADPTARPDPSRLNTQDPHRPTSVRRLVVAEKFSAALRIATILADGPVHRLRADGVGQFSLSQGSDEIRVLPLRGHFVTLDYPEVLQRWDAVELRTLIDTESVRKVTMPDVFAALRAAAAGQDEVVVATDFDREGELIGAEAVEVVREENPSAVVRRARFSALTRADIESSFSQLTDLDRDLAASARTREAIDLLWGSVLTRFLTLAIADDGHGVLSVGRVQTPTLAVLESREREIEEFVPKPFWDVVADLTAHGADIEAALARGRLWRRDEAEAAQGLAALATEAIVTSSAVSVREERPPAPLHTTRFLALADQRGVPPHRAMTAAESLYQHGRISYPRTDNTVYPPTMGLRRLVERLRDSDLAAEADIVLGLPRIRPTRGRQATTDHPPIYPTGAARKSELSEAEWNVYDLIARHFLATLCPPARLEVSTADVALDDVPFRATGTRIVDPGWRAVVARPLESLPGLPPIEMGDRIAVRGVRVRTGQTAPPLRYSPGTLIQEMERLGLGTKSTRHEIVQKLFSRDYIHGHRIRISARGRAVVEALATHAPRAVSAELTRDLEIELDAIARGELGPDTVLGKARNEVRAVLADLEAHREGITRWIRGSIRLESDYGPCEACGSGRMVLRRGRSGNRFLGCSNFPECRTARPPPREGFLVRAPPEEATLPQPSEPSG